MPGSIKISSSLPRAKHASLVAILDNSGSYRYSGPTLAFVYW